MSTKHFDERITSRYGEREKELYRQVIDLVKKNNLAKSRAQLLLVERGLQHTQNPEPIIKTVIKEVPVEKIVEKVVYRDPPRQDEHIQEHVAIEEHIQGDPPKSGQHPSADKLMTQDKAGPPVTALEEKKSATKENGISGWKVAGSLGLAGLVAYIGYKIYLVYR